MVRWVSGFSLAADAKELYRGFGSIDHRKNNDNREVYAVVCTDWICGHVAALEQV